MDTKTATIISGITLAPAIGGLAYRKFRQSRISRQLRMNTPNAINEERYVAIGGIQQWIQVRGEDRDNPVLLMVHGGPGWPNATFNLPLRSWEKHFTVVQWDQRGTGKTLRRSGKSGSGTMTFEQRVSDAIELTEFLREYLHQEKVILLAESMGTLVGLPLVQRRPDLFAAVVLTDLYVNMIHNEAMKYQMTLERLLAAGDTKGAVALRRIGPDPACWSLDDWNVNMMWAFKTNRPIPNLDRTLLFPLVLFSPIYSLRDLYWVFAGFAYCTQAMYEEIKAFDARRLGTQFDVPVFLLQGAEDVITVTSLAEAYFAEINAPQKHLSLIQNAGHFAAFTQPDLFLAELNTRVSPILTIASAGAIEGAEKNISGETAAR